MRFILILCLFLSSLAFAETNGEYKPLPKYTPDEKIAIEEFEKALKHVYVGMPEDKLYEVFAHWKQKSYYKEGNEEWITFSNAMTEASGDTIAFYLKQGTVKGWEVNNPEQKVRLEGNEMKKELQGEFDRMHDEDWSEKQDDLY